MTETFITKKEEKDGSFTYKKFVMNENGKYGEVTTKQDKDGNSISRTINFRA